MWTTLQTRLALIHARLHDLANDERGYSTEAVVVTALLIALALAALTVITAAVTGKAHQISTTL